ncbi:toll-like receptor 13 [Anneissia japonica]|uniref:toll-like receptor 13 n=1 Tax=Anneissia japonica TaxID=1529436 RepID=UPI00142576B0|nr:toll-like receptor 13 [Anneissia japonica]
MAFASRKNLSSPYLGLFSMATLCFLSCVSLHHVSGGHIQNVTELACPEVCSCNLNGLVNCSYRNLIIIPDKTKLPVDTNVYLLQYNTISALSGYSFNTTPNLTFLDLYHNKLISIDEKAFAGLARLQVLNISNQVFDQHTIHIQKISKNWFKGFTELTVAKLMLIGAEVIDDYAFSDNPNIKEIQLDSNNLKDIPSHLFQNLPDLKIVQLCCNLLTEIDGKPFFGSTHVEEIHLNSNSINKVHENAFKSMMNIYVIDLGDNQLTSDNIHRQTFTGLACLTELYLYRNHLKTIRKEWLQDLTSLEVFHAGHNSVITLDDNVFKNCLNLKEIDLSYNLIVEIHSTLFRGLPNLMCVICSNNKIYNIRDDAFQGSKNISTLKFNSNVFKTVSKSIGLQHLPNLDHIFFFTNPFQCDCDLVWFISWIHSPNVRPYMYNLDDVVCNGPPNLALRRLLDLDPDSFSCSSHVVAIVVSNAVVLIIIASVLYYFRWDIRYLHQKRKLRKQYQQLNEDVDGPPNIEGYIFDAFISYSSKDCNWVSNVLHPTLENDPYNFRLCIDYRDFMPGDSIIDNIARAIRCSRKTIMILTKNFLRSQWCYFELEMARLRLLENSEDLFIIVLLEKVATKNMPLKLQQVLRKKSYIRWPDDEPVKRVFWTKLETELRSQNHIN